jgi:predicted metal-dependent peptidase
MAHVLRIADSKEQAGKFLPPAKRFKKDVFTEEGESAYDDLIVAKSQLLKEFPFWGILGMTVVLVEMPEEQLPTLATDGMHIFYNPNFTSSLTKGERVFALAHELFHGLYEHAGRTSRFESYTGVNIPRNYFDLDNAKKERNTDEINRLNEKIKEGEELSRLWNFAADFVVNTGLVEARVGEFIKTIQILYDDKYIGWAVEEVYDDLLENPDKVPQQAQCLDQHIEIEVIPDDEMGDNDSAEQSGEGNVRIKIKQSDFDKLSKEWKDNMVSAAAEQKEHELRESATASCIPSSIQRYIDELAKPKVNWRAALRRAVQQVQNRRYTFKTPNKVHFSRGFTLPGFRDRVNKLDVAIFVDTSASVSPAQLTAFISEFSGMMSAFPRYKIHAHCFDSHVVPESVITLEKHNNAEGWNHLGKFVNRVGGGGGTDFMCNWEYLIANKIKPRMIIMLTDGYPYGEWGVQNYAPTIFFMMGNGSKNKAPFGMTLHYEDL